MLSIYNRATLETALEPPALRNLITSRWDLAEANGLADLTHIVVVHPGDQESQIQAEIGFNPLVSPLDGARYGSREFRPYWAWLQEVDGWYEMIVTVGDSGFAFVLLIGNSDQVMPQLRQLCEEYSQCA